MKTGFCISILENKSKYAPFLYNGILEPALEKASALGFKGIEISFKTPDDLHIKKTRILLERYNLEITAFAIGQNLSKNGISFLDDNSQIRKEAIKHTKDNIKLAAQFGSFIIIGGIRGLNNDIRIETAESRIKECLCEIMDEAEKYQIEIIFEPINRYESSFGNSLEASIEFVKKFGCSNLKLMCDTYHMNIEDTSFYQGIVEAGPLNLIELSGEL